MRYLFMLFLALSLLTGMSTGASANSAITLTVDGELQQYTTPPLIIDGRTVVPMRPIFETLGATVGWNQTTQSVQIQKGETTVELKIGSSTAKVNGVDVPLDIEPLLINETTMVPVRFVCEVTNAEVEWIADEHRIEITTTQAEEAASNGQNGQKITPIETGATPETVTDEQPALTDSVQSVDAATLDQLRGMLDQQYSKLATKTGTFKLGKWNVQNEANQVVITAQLDPTQYLDYVKQYQKIKPELEKQAAGLLQLLEAQLPEHSVSLRVLYVKDFAFKPKSFDADELENRDGKWWVHHALITIETGETSEWAVES